MQPACDEWHGAAGLKGERRSPALMHVRSGRGAHLPGVLRWGLSAAEGAAGAAGQVGGIAPSIKMRLTHGI